MADLPRYEPPQRLVRTLGPGHPWLARLPELAERLLNDWELTLERVVAPGGRESTVALVHRADGTPAALKLLAADERPVADEAAALRHWDGLGAVRLLRADPRAGALLLERLHGETSLRSLPDAKATLEAMSTVRRLWVPPGEHPFTTVADHTGAQVDRVLGAAPEEVRPLVREALAAREELLGTPGPGVLLHGDFRQGVVLAADDPRAQWLAVGPQPLVGEPEYDLARLVRDRLHDLMASPGAPAQVRRRIRKLADSLDLDRERLRGWTLYRAVESGVRQLLTGDREDGEMLLEFAGWV
ncbi:aminoglycoside phosphotransferase family protein [Streptomyces sp. XM4193]|uniref:aminoglycoside phosphotransferase family protein n=1 Tax=Streptomyces sp. XM4193 TaxID=2929782 RepID=UPI001FF75B87|nr:aminoglycoside phosphotransferase family protein [Streptomyces sp. XM4193]MCK1798877.1 aminoglycoside phosphotransferase family protein [Streptomyces sp. XM4193]